MARMRNGTFLPACGVKYGKMSVKFFKLLNWASPTPRSETPFSEIFLDKLNKYR